MRTKLDAVQFFVEHAGCSWNPATETKEEGQRRCATSLAQAELDALEGGFSFAWSIDPTSDSSDWDDSDEPWAVWQCCMLNAEGKIVNSLHSIDFGRDGSPWSDPYRRVVEAELSLEGLTNEPQCKYRGV